MMRLEQLNATKMLKDMPQADFQDSYKNWKYSWVQRAICCRKPFKPLFTSHSPIRLYKTCFFFQKVGLNLRKTLWSSWFIVCEVPIHETHFPLRHAANGTVVNYHLTGSRLAVRRPRCLGYWVSSPFPAVWAQLSRGRHKRASVKVMVAWKIFAVEE